MPDLTQLTAPAGFDADLWNQLKDVKSYLDAHGLTIPSGTVGH